MSATGRPEESTPAASDAAARLRAAELVRLVAARTGDAVAAAGLLMRALDSRGVAVQCSVVPVTESARRETDADLTLALGRQVPEAEFAFGIRREPATSTARSVAAEFGSVDHELALAGLVAAGASPDDLAAEQRGVERRPGIGTPTPDLVDALAHSTLVHVPCSGDVTAAEKALAGIDADTERSEAAENALRRVASLVACRVCSDERTTPRGAEAVERFLRPLVAPGGRFPTVEGYADVLDAVARERPGLAVPLALGTLETDKALEAWRSHARRAHEAIRAGSTGRYDGLFVVRCESDAPVGTVARLVAAFRSPEPLVVAVDESSAACVAVDERSEHLGNRVEATAATVGGTGGGTATCGRAQFEGDPTEFVAAFREQ